MHLVKATIPVMPARHDQEGAPQASSNPWIHHSHAHAHLKLEQKSDAKGGVRTAKRGVRTLGVRTAEEVLHRTLLERCWPRGLSSGLTWTGSRLRIPQANPMTLSSVLVILQQANHTAGLLQLLLQLQNRRLPTLCLLQIVQRHPLTIEALHTVGVGLELEPAA